MIRLSDDIEIAESEVTFHFAPSAGPGGQNVNKVATAAQLRFDAAGSPTLPEDVRARLRGVAGGRMSAAGVIVIKAQRYRSQERNREDALERLVKLIGRAASPPRSRRPTRPSRAAVERRLDSKSRRGSTKRLRGPVLDNDA